MWRRKGEGDWKRNVAVLPGSFLCLDGGGETSGKTAGDSN